MKQGVRIFLYLLPALLCLGLGIALAVDPGMALPLTSARLAARKQAIANTLSMLEKCAAENQAMLESTSAMRKIRAGAIRRERQTAAMLFRERLDEAARQAVVPLRSISDIQQRELADGEILLLETGFSTECRLEELATLANLFHTGVPHIYWKNLTIKQTNRRDDALLAVNAVVCAVVMAPEEELD